MVTLSGTHLKTRLFCPKGILRIVMHNKRDHFFEVHFFPSDVKCITMVSLGSGGLITHYEKRKEHFINQGY
jgi:hypothetical protein